MPRLKKKHRDMTDWAADVVTTATGTKVSTDIYERLLARQAAKAGKNPAAVSLGRLGGLKGGKARAKALSAAKRTKIAKSGAAARWDREKQVLALLKKGITAKEVSDKFGVTPERAKTMLSRARAKLTEALSPQVVSR